MKKCILILPYFGPFKVYFPLFLQSCRWNKEIDWLLITDNKVANLPDNFILLERSFDELVELFKQKISPDINLKMPYKLCDYKPAYGLAFEGMIEEYDYWGYCDCDLIFGELKKFLQPLMENDYDKIFVPGHLTLYKNYPENNRRFWGTENEDRMVFYTEKTLGFDEPFFDRQNIHHMFLQQGAKVYENDLSANPAVRHDQFVLTRYNADKRMFQEQPYRKTLYYWSDGHIKGMYVENGKLASEEYAYMHFQNRKMRMDVSEKDSDWNQYYVVPNRFKPLKSIPTTVEEWELIDLEPKNTHIWDLRIQTIKYKVKRLKEKMLKLCKGRRNAN